MMPRTVLSFGRRLPLPTMTRVVAWWLTSILHLQVVSSGGLVPMPILSMAQRT